jgi:hypothetical protein
VLVVVALSAAALASAGRPRDTRFVPELRGDHFGFTTWGGRLVINPHFDMVTPFRDGRAAASINGKWGFIDEEGRWVGKPKYDWIHPEHFDHGPALVSANGVYGYVSRDGIEVIPLSLDQATPFVAGYACIFEPQAMRFGIVDAEGLPVTGFRFDACEPRFVDGRAPVRIGDRWGFVGTDGAMAIEARFDRAESFCDGLALVEDGGLRAYIDVKGRRRIPANMQVASSFSDGRARVSFGPDRVGFLDRSGRVVVKDRWRDARDFAGGVAWVQEPASGRWGLIDPDGNVIIAPKYEDPGDFVEGLARVARDGKYGFVDVRGRVVVPLRYESVGSFREGLVTVSTERGGKQGVVDRDGKVVIEERYDQIGSFRGGVAQVTECRWEKQGVLGPEAQVCAVFYVDRKGAARVR